ncbi:hypothetical protein ACFW5G_21695 [Streptomyces griseoaurantiacus]|uniref:hypothetical protein n=1 Tax=Streptomyces griseoaurantiacus TaxID=68213 RepID=UPI003681FD2C
MPLTVSIAVQPSGAVVATGGDVLAHDLLRQAGFTRHADWHGIRHRLPARMPHEEQLEIAERAVRMLGAARYLVELDLALSEMSPAGAVVLDLLDQVRGAEHGRALARVIGQLVDGERGVLIRLQEALEAAAEQVTELDVEAYELSDRISAVAEQLFALNEVMTGVVLEAAALAPGLDRAAVQAKASSRNGSNPRTVSGAATATTPVVPEASKGGRGR